MNAAWHSKVVLMLCSGGVIDDEKYVVLFTDPSVTTCAISKARKCVVKMSRDH
jgi:hypothetical protein